MAQIWWEPSPADIGIAPSDLVIQQLWETFPYVQVGYNPNYSDPLALKLGSDGVGGNVVRGIAITSIAGQDVSALSGGTELYWHFKTVGASSSGGILGRVDASGDPAVAQMRSRASGDFSLAAREFRGGVRYALPNLGASIHNKNLVITKARFSVTDTLLKVKMWYPDTDDTEPAWELEGEPPWTMVSSGSVGFVRDRNSTGVTYTLDIFGFGVGTNGDPAPMGPVSSSRRRSSLILTPW